MPELPHLLERTVTIKADPEIVFRYFTDSMRWANWWGTGSTIDAQPGGEVYIRYANGVEARGEVLAIRAPEEITFTLGYLNGQPMAVGSSRIIIRLQPAAEGTRLWLQHAFADELARDQHVQGWRFQLSVFSNVVANEVFRDAGSRIDAWFEAWTVGDDARRASCFAAIASPAIEFRDRYSLLSGIEDLSAHAGAALKFMPGVLLRRKGEIRQCQGTALAEWTVPAKDGQEMISGTNVFVFDAGGKIQSVTGLANA